MREKGSGGLREEREGRKAKGLKRDSACIYMCGYDQELPKKKKKNPKSYKLYENNYIHIYIYIKWGLFIH